MAEEKKDGSSTTVTEVELDINDILGTPGAGNIMVPSNGEQKKVEKPNFFSAKPVDMSFIDNNDNDDDSDDDSEDGKDKAPVIPKASDEDIDKDLDDINQDSDPSKKTGRPKMDKNAMVELTKKLIEKKQFVPFDDDKALEDYTVQDFEELFEANMT